MAALTGLMQVWRGGQDGEDKVWRGGGDGEEECTPGSMLCFVSVVRFCPFFVLFCGIPALPLLPLMVSQGAEGAGNLARFAEAWKPVGKEEAAREGMRGFGHPMLGTPGAVPAAVSWAG